MSNIVNKKVRRTPDEAFTLRNKAIYSRILVACKVKNANKLAEYLEPKVGRTTVYDWRKGRVEPSKENLEVISRKTGVSVDWIINGDEAAEANYSEMKESDPISLKMSKLGSRFNRLPPVIRSKGQPMIDPVLDALNKMIDDLEKQ